MNAREEARDLARAALLIKKGDDFQIGKHGKVCSAVSKEDALIFFVPVRLQKEFAEELGKTVYYEGES